MIIKKCCSLGMIIVLVIFIRSLGYTQEASELAFIAKSNPLYSQKAERASLNLRQTSNIKLISMGLIRFYQLFISSQSIPVCNFTPSCSQFGMEAIERYGFIKGFLLTSDRLQRCHPCAKGYYFLDKERGKAIDPVTNYGD